MQQLALPELCPFHGNWPPYEDELFTIYLQTVARGQLTFQGCEVRCQYMPATKGKGYAFWHVISEGKVEDERTPDLRRCERIRWIAWFIANVDRDDRLVWWENRRGNNTHVVIWMASENFAVILAKRNNYYSLKSAYMVAKYRAEDFRRELATYRKSHQKG